jgi:hypothetical protein
MKLRRRTGSEKQNLPLRRGDAENNLSFPMSEMAEIEDDMMMRPSVL